MRAAFVFGNLGNLANGLGKGWSAEDAYAWAVGRESELTLPLPADDVSYILRLDIHPAVFPPAITRQRLTVRSAGIDLGSFELTGRSTITIRLPGGLTRHQAFLRLDLFHPDAGRPSDFLRVSDSRPLAVCFHSASFVAESPSEDGGNTQESALPQGPVRGIIAGTAVARQLCEVLSRLPSLKRRFGFCFLNSSLTFEETTATLRSDAFAAAQVCWLEVNSGTASTRQALRQTLPGDCAIRSYHAPACKVLWPFLGRDGRAVVEPGRYQPARYPFGDQIAQSLAGSTLADDDLFLAYEAAVQNEPMDLDTMFKSDLRRWRGEDAKSDMHLADFIDRHMRTDRLFLSPKNVGPVLLREMARQILDDAAIRDVAGINVLLSELDALLEGFVGAREEIPVHGIVARHFALSWWSADMKYRWHNNKRSQRDYILDYIRWTPWRP